MAAPKQAKDIIGIIETWTKLIVLGGSAIVTCTYAYYKIFDLEKNQVDDRKHFEEQLKIGEVRSDKRYLRAMEVAKELKELGMYQEKRINELEKEVAYLKGLNSTK